MGSNKSAASTANYSVNAHEAAERCIAEVIAQHGGRMRAGGADKGQVRQRCTTLAVAAAMQRAAELQSVALELLGQRERRADPVWLHATLDQMLQRRRG